MPVVAIIYGEQSTIIRRIVHCDTIEELGSGNHYGPGEEILIIDAAEIVADGCKPDLEKAKAKVKAKKNKDAPSSRCVIVDALGTVLDIVQADPILDQIDGGKTIEQSDDAEIGWKKVGGKLRPPDFPGGGAAAIDAAKAKV